MKHQLKFLIICYWFYLNILFGFFLSKIFYDFFDEINDSSVSKIIEFRKKFNFDAIKIKFFNYILKFFKDWIKRIGLKFILLLKAIDRVIKTLKICRKKFKSILKFKYNFRLLKNLLPIFWETFLIFCSLINEILFLKNIKKWIFQWIVLIRLLMNESVFITRIVYFLYFILLSLFGILTGFLLGLYRRHNHINAFLLLLLLKIIYNYNNRFDDVLLQYLYHLSLETNTVEPFYKFSIKFSQQIIPNSVKIIFKQPEQILFPFSIIEDPIIFISTEFFWEEPINFKFQLFQFYQNVNDKVKH